jgi:hypothetical protein
MAELQPAARRLRTAMRGRPELASAIVAIAPFAALAATLFLIDEVPSRLDLAELKNTFHGLLATFTHRDLWLIGIFYFSTIATRDSVYLSITKSPIR